MDFVSTFGTRSEYGVLTERARLKRAYESLGARFSYMLGGVRQERNLPFDPVPRIISAGEFAFLERGLSQRVTALNMFLADIYGKARILKERALDTEFVLSSSGFLARCVGVRPRGGIYAHIAGIDLVKDGFGKWFVLEDNLRVPSGAAYPLSARLALRRSLISDVGAEDSLVYGSMLKETMEHVSGAGISVILTTGRDNCAYYEHSFLAEATGSALATAAELFVDSDVLYFKGAEKVERVGALYSRIDGVFADPLFLNGFSCVGVPGLFGAYAAGNTAVLNAFGCGAADDKGLYFFVPELIRYYLGEEPVLDNAPTFLPTRSADMSYIKANAEKLVIKGVGGSGGHEVVFAGELTKDEREELLRKVAAHPREYVAQEIIDFETLSVDGEKRRADLRAFVLTGESVRVWKSGLTRFAGGDGYIVNSSEGGGFKDTWVLFR